MFSCKYVNLNLYIGCDIKLSLQTEYCTLNVCQLFKIQLDSSVRFQKMLQKACVLCKSRCRYSRNGPNLAPREFCHYLVLPIFHVVPTLRPQRRQTGRFHSAQRDEHRNRFMSEVFVNKPDEVLSSFRFLVFKEFPTHERVPRKELIEFRYEFLRFDRRRRKRQKCPYSVQVAEGSALPDGV